MAIFDLIWALTCVTFVICFRWFTGAMIDVWLAWRKVRTRGLPSATATPPATTATTAYRPGPYDQMNPCYADDCDKCHPLPRWKISRHRIQHLTYTREIKAATAEEAMTLFEAGTAWPSQYDDDYGEIVQLDDPVTVLMSPQDYCLSNDGDFQEWLKRERAALATDAASNEVASEEGR